LAYRIYETEFKDQRNGQVGITLNCDWQEPLVDDQDHRDASDRALRFNFGWYAHPIFFGTYPPEMRDLIDAKSELEGRNSSRLPSFDANWTEIITGSTDFIGLNHYTTNLVAPMNRDGEPGLAGDSDTVSTVDESWEGSAAPWLFVVPYGIRRMVNWISREYNQPPIYITENGYADFRNATVDDPRRVNYYQSYINELMKAVVVDGSDVRGYTGWSLIDNFEWGYGYTQRYGLHYVDWEDPTLTRVAKRSAICLKEIFRSNGFPSGPICSVE